MKIWCKTISQTTCIDFYPTGNHMQPDLTLTTNLSQDITTKDIKSIIKHFNDKAPSQRAVRKTVMQQLSGVAIAKLKTLFNWDLSMGYYPTKFKNAIMAFITKGAKDPRKVEIYKPLLLLGTPGKIFENKINNNIQCTGKQ